MFKRESLEKLREQVDLVDVLSSYIELKRAGAYHKALCPFHDEKTPSFCVQKGDKHYHCFGCGEHGDAIQFLMTFLNMGFVEAVETLAERFNVPLERSDQKQETGPSKSQLKEALAKAAQIYHELLLHNQAALQYLEGRGLQMDFIRRFQLGWAEEGHLRGIDHLETVGLVRNGREFFSDRILFPICDRAGSIIGFSGRKIKESTFGGKYINTPETPLFHKSRILFGLHFCRRRIAKERKAIVVEGQIDALRLIHEGLNLVVAGQGTAFGEGQVQELVQLGVREVYLALDADAAGRKAAAKIGSLFQREGIAVKVALLPQGADPDTLLNTEGLEGFTDKLKESVEYLPFLITHFGDLSTPAGKNALVKRISAEIRSWNDPILIHESLRQLAQLTGVPEEMLGVGSRRRTTLTRRPAGVASVDPNEILEADVLRWILLMHDISIAKQNLQPDDFHIPAFRQIFEAFLENPDADLLSLAAVIENEEVLAPILQRKINRDKAEELYPQAVLKLLERNWMEQREELNEKIRRNPADALELLKEFNRLTKTPPTLA